MLKFSIGSWMWSTFSLDPLTSWSSQSLVLLIALFLDNGLSFFFLLVCVIIFSWMPYIICRRTGELEVNRTYVCKWTHFFISDDVSMEWETEPTQPGVDLGLSLIVIFNTPHHPYFCKRRLLSPELWVGAGVLIEFSVFSVSPDFSCTAFLGLT